MSEQPAPAPHPPHQQNDSLLECLVILARMHERPRSHDALTAGLPLVNNRLTPSLFERAAQRAGLVSKLLRSPIQKINPALLPVVLLMDDGRACLLVGWLKSDSVAQVILPELGEAIVNLPLVELETHYAGQAILARPQFQFDSRAPTVGNLRHRHWFWGPC